MIRFPLLLALLLLSIAPQLSTANVFATYNIRYDNANDVKAGNGWPDRLPVIADLIRFHGFDLVGTQEGLMQQMIDLQHLLPEHAVITFGRNDGDKKGEHIGIFYRKDKYKLLKGGRFWLSETPDKPGIGWDAVLPRICTWGNFEDLDSGKAFLVFNIHFDHKGEQARIQSAKLLLKKAAEIAADQPVILMGDFNANQNSSLYKNIEQSGKVRDSYETAPIRFAHTGTFNAFNPNRDNNSRIDHIFASEEFEVIKYGILTDSYRTTETNPETGKEKSVARLPSDHFPVVIHTRWK